MARRGRNDIEVAVVGEADFGRARKDAARDLDRIEDDAKDTARDIERAFDDIELSPELDKTEIREAIDLAQDLDGMVARFDIDTDLDEIKQAEQIARSLRAFQGRVDLSVEGRDELKEALGLAETMDQVRQVKVQVQGQQDLERAKDLAEDLEQTRTVRVNVDDGDIDQIDDQLTEAGERGADGIEGAIGGIDFGDIGGTAVDQLTGALSAAGPWAAAGAAAGALFAGDLIGGINDGVGRNRQVMLDSLSSGLPTSDVRRIGDEVGGAFTDGFGDSLEELREDAILLISNLSDLPTALDDRALIEYGATAKQVFGIDIPEQVETVKRLIGNELVATTEDAYQLMAANSQVFGLQAEENLEVLKEYSPIFSRLKLEGVDALGAVGAAAQDAVFENVDMAGDSLKEMLIRLDSLESSDAMASLGLDIQQVNTAIEQGRSDEVLATIADRLGDVTTESERMAVATEIFGTAVEGANLDKFLAWLDGIGENAPQATQSLEDMADTVENSVGPWTNLGRSVRDTTGDFIGLFNSNPDKPLHEILGMSDTATVQQMLDKLDEWRARAIISQDQFEEFRGTLFDFNEVPWTAMERGLTNMSDAADDVTDDFNLASGAVRSLDEQFAALEGRFDSSASLRRIQEQSESLLESVDQLESGLFTAGGQFDRTDPAARRFESTLEDLNGTLITASQNLADGTITTDQFRIMQRNAEEAIRAAGEAAGRSDAEVQDMIATYTRVPDRINTDVGVDTSQGRAELSRFLSTVNSSTGTVRLDADGSFARAELNRFLRLAGGSRATVSIGGSGRSNPNRGSNVFHEGGLFRTGRGSGSEGVAILEDGERVLSREQTADFDRGRGGVQTLRLEFADGGTDLERAMFRMFRKAVQNRGGNVQVAVGGRR